MIDLSSRYVIGWSMLGRTYTDLPFCAWKAKYSGMTVTEAERPKALEDENAKLKRLLAEQMLYMAEMKEMLSKNW